MALSPWPTSAVALTNATATLKAIIGPDLTNERVQALGAAAAALVEKYAPDAPQAIKDEAVTRSAGWLAEAPAGGQRRENTGDVDTAFTPAATGALRASGGMGYCRRVRCGAGERHDTAFAATVPGHRDGSQHLRHIQRIRRTATHHDGHRGAGKRSTVGRVG